MSSKYVVETVYIGAGMYRLELKQNTDWGVLDYEGSLERTVDWVERSVYSNEEAFTSAVQNKANRLISEADKADKYGRVMYDKL